MSAGDQVPVNNHVLFQYCTACTGGIQVEIIFKKAIFVQGFVWTMEKMKSTLPFYTEIMIFWPLSPGLAEQRILISIV